MQTINLGHGIGKSVNISLENLLKGCLKVLDETEKIKAQARLEFPNIDW